MLKIGEFALAGDGLDGDADKVFNQCPAAAGEPPEAVTGEQILPSLVEFAFADS